MVHGHGNSPPAGLRHSFDVGVDLLTLSTSYSFLFPFAFHNHDSMYYDIDPEVDTISISIWRIFGGGEKKHPK